MILPGYDGTGPAGRGPMTGRGEGFCLLKLPSIPDEPLIGFAGGSGYPVRLSSGASGTDLASLGRRLQSLEAGLRDIRRRLGALERNGRSITSEPES